ncbi:hypothetical protein [Methanobrevibacter sp.]
MSNLLNKKVQKKTVKDLKEILKNVDDNLEIVLGFYRKTDGVYFGYLADILTNLKYDSVTKEKLQESKVVELACYDDEYCTYIEDVI